MKDAMKISEARARLPELAKRVVREAGAVEYIEHRDLPERLALTTESYIRFLETTVTELKRMRAEPFSLEGSITSTLSNEELEAAFSAARESQASQDAAGFRELLD